MNNKLEAVIIGAGFGGVGMAIRLMQAGIDSFVILEKGEDVGGCWRENTYPGAACDVPSNLYSFSFEPNPNWTRRFAPQAEIFAYLRHCARKYNVYPKVRFGCEVEQARYDDASQRWSVTTRDGEHYDSRLVIAATGQLNRPAMPQLGGEERFTGSRFHSARWDHDVDLRGKRVGVIGTGASAIQFVPAIMDQVASLTLFQRSAAYVLPKPDRAYTPLEQKLFDKLPATQKFSRGAIYSFYETRVFGFSGFDKAMAIYRLRAQQHMRRAVKDATKRAQLTPDYPIGCKRILLSNDYFEALAQDKASIVTDRIQGFTEKGLATADGREHAFDVIIYGTGFQATDFLAPMRITGRDGVDLNQAWRDGAEAYYGMTVHGFPNLFMLYGPNTNLGHNSIVYMLESQFNHIMSCLDSMEQTGAGAIEVRETVQASFNAALQEQIRATVWDQGCTSWYKNESGKNTNNWPGFTFRYRQAIRTVKADDYEFSSR